MEIKFSEEGSFYVDFKECRGWYSNDRGENIQVIGNHFTNLHRSWAFKKNVYLFLID